MYSPRLLLKDYWLSIPALSALVALVIDWWYVLVNLPSTGERIFLHYNVTFGIDLAGARAEAFIPLAAGTAIWLVNVSVAVLIYHHRFLARCLSIFTAIFELMLFYGMWLLVGLNI